MASLYDFTRLITEGQMDMTTGQILGSGFCGNVYGHLHSKSTSGEVSHTHTPRERTLSMSYFTHPGSGNVQ